MTQEQFPIALANGHTAPGRFLDNDGTAWWMDQLRARQHIDCTVIGESRGGSPIYGLRAGYGPVHISITAGAHADEPAGPIAACVLAWLLSEDDCQSLRDRFSFAICPQINPDGAEANKKWFAAVPDVETYLGNVVREEPGDDIEFGYPGDGKNALRPENQAVAEFLRLTGPYSCHASLHSMGMAEGAWFLIEKSWADRTLPLQQRLAELAYRRGFALHDIQRNGDKGFTRIRRGFCTTPTGAAMRDHFLKADDPVSATKFQLSSMEFIKSLGGNPLAIVSEVPVFALGGGWSSGNSAVTNTDPPGTSKNAIFDSAPATDAGPSPGETRYERYRDLVKKHLAAGDIAGAVDEARRAGVVPVPFSTHVALQVETVLAACEFVVADDLPDIVKGVLSDDTSGRNRAT